MNLIAQTLASFLVVLGLCSWASARLHLFAPTLTVWALEQARTTPRRPAHMPTGHPRIAHFMPYLRGDALTAPKRARRLGYWFIDQNVQKDAQGERWVLHWGRFRKQWRWQWTGRYVGKGRLRREERVRVKYHQNFLNQLSTAEVARLRSARIGGSRPHLLRAHMAECAHVGITLCAEFKYTPTREEWVAIAHDAAQTGVTMIVMRLSNVAGGIIGAYHCLSWAAEVGLCGALLPRGRKPLDWDTRWAPLGIQKWGRWRRSGQ